METPPTKTYKPSEKTTVFNKNDSLATRARKLKAAKESNSSTNAHDAKPRRIEVKELKAATEEPTNHDVQFLIQVLLSVILFIRYIETIR